MSKLFDLPGDGLRNTVPGVAIVDPATGLPITNFGGGGGGGGGVEPAYKTIIDAADETTTYICEALPGTATSDDAWRITRVQTVGTVQAITYAGDGGFNQVADDRAELTYN